MVCSSVSVRGGAWRTDNMERLTRLTRYSWLAGLPATRQQRRQFGLFHGWQSGQHVAHIFPWINAAATAAHDDTVNDRAAPSRVGVPNEQPVLLAHGAGPNRILGQIVVYLQTPVLQIPVQRLPFGQGALRQTTGQDRLQSGLERFQEWRRHLLAQFQSCGG